MKYLLGALKALFLPIRFIAWLIARLIFRAALSAQLSKKSWVVLEIEGEVVELTRPSKLPGFARSLLGLDEKPKVVLADLRKLVQYVESSHAAGVIVRLGTVECGWAHANAIREELRRLAQSKEVWVHIRSVAQNPEMLIATGGSKVFALPAAHIAAVGAGSSGLYLGRLLDTLGVEMEATARGRYKSAVEALTRSGRSPDDRYQTEALIGRLDERLTQALAEQRQSGVEAADALIEAGPSTGSQAADHGLVDGALDEETLFEKAAELRHLGSEIKLRRGSKISALSEPPRRFTTTRRRVVGVVEVRGAILDADSSLGYVQDQAVAKSVVTDLREALDDDRVGAVVLYVDSRGGSAAASEVIAGAVRRLDQEKPVVAYFGDVAASGGYLVACPARAILASPLSITGSIGVFQVLPRVGRLLDRLGIDRDSVARHTHAMFYSPFEPASPAAKALATEQIAEQYERFVARVAESRGRPFEEIEPLAQGRVYAGVDALEVGLVDALGGLGDAVEHAKSLAEGRLDPEPELIQGKKVRLFGPAEPAAAALCGPAAEVASLLATRARIWAYDPLSLS